MKKIFLAFLILILVITSTLALGSCDQLLELFPNGEVTDAHFKNVDMVLVYEIYLDYVNETGETPLSYDEWFTAVHGENFQKGIIPEIRKNQDTDFWEISYNNGRGWNDLKFKTENDDQKSCNHTYGKWITICENNDYFNGIRYRECKYCDYKDYQFKIADSENNQQEHTHTYTSTVTDPNCSEKGYTTYVCSCGHSYVSDYTDKTKHTYGDWYESRPATCTQNGEERRDCADCSSYETRDTDKESHKYSAVITEPKCYMQGYTTYTCDCSDTYIDNYTDKTDHEYTDWYEITVATCTENGEERRDCINCTHYELKKTNIKTHEYSITVTPPTCNEKGYTTYSCNCGYSYVDNYTDKLNHSYGGWYEIVPSSCNQSGQERRDCIDCDSHETRDTGTTSHAYSTSTTPPTCDKEGYTTYSCRYCTDSYNSDFKEPTGHSKAISKVVPPTCISAGYTEYYCINCDYTSIGDYTYTSEHSYGEWYSTSDPDCTGYGTEERICSVCENRETRSTGPLGHSYTETKVEATCEKQGYTIFKCNNCHYGYYGDYTPKADHNYKPISICPPTCFAEGYTLYLCDCGYCYYGDYTETIDHSYGDSWQVTITPSCTEKGEKVRYCSMCGKDDTQEVDPLGHSLTYHAEKHGNCMELCWKEYESCENCDHTTQSDIYYGSHTYDENERCIYCGGTDEKYFTVTLYDGDVYAIGAKDKNNLPSEIVIPFSYEGKKVTAINDNGFSVCENLVSVTIPSNVTHIFGYAFLICYSLENVYIEDGVEHIGNGAFQHTGIKNIFIPSSVSYIGGGVFTYCEDNIETIVVDSNNPIYRSENNCLIEKDTNSVIYGCKNSIIPDCITSIAGGAFSGCSGLTSISIPDSVTTIGGGAFGYCENLSELTLGKNVITIEDEAFGHTALTNIYIPKSVESIGHYSFYLCSKSAKTIKVEEGNKFYWAEGNCLVEKETGTLLLGCNYSVIPEGVITIDNDAFWYCDTLSTLIFPSTLTHVEGEAFRNCKNINNISVAKNNPVYRSEGNCLIEKATNVLILGSNCSVIPEGVTSIGVYAFAEKEKLESINIPSSVKYIESCAFEGCYSLYSVTIETGLVSIGDRAFNCCYSLKEITLPTSLTTIGYMAFRSCMFYTILIPDSVAVIKDYAFADCVTLETIYCASAREPEGFENGWNGGYTVVWGYNNMPEVPDTPEVTDGSLGLEYTLSDDYTYYIVSGIGTCTDTALVIPSTYKGLPVQEIGDEAFKGNNFITSLITGGNVTNIGKYAFDACYVLETLILSDSLVSIEEYAFQNCYAINDLIIGKGLKDFPLTSFYYCNGMSNIEVDEENPYYSSIDGNCYDKAETKLIRYAVGKTNTHFDLPSTVVTIGEQSFYGNECLVSITISGSVKTVGMLAFATCTNITDVYYCGSADDWAKISKGYGNGPISNATVYYYSETEPNTVGNFWHYVDGSITLWPRYVPTYSQGLEYTLSDDGTYYTVTGIGTCTDTELVIPSTYNGLPVKEIGYAAFEYCRHLTSINIPNSITEIRGYAFFSCEGLTSITIPDSVTNLGERVFAYCRSLTSITIPESVTSIPPWMLYYCDSLASINIHKNITSIGNRAFGYCYGLTSIVIHKGVTSIDSYAFKASGNLTIYCETESKPESWNEYWNISECPVVWGYTK